MDHGTLKINYLAVRPERVEGQTVNCDTVSQGGGKFFRELDTPQLCCGVLHFLLAEISSITYCERYPLISLTTEMIIF